jgi:DNA-binding response OmpR family regulator
LTVEDDERIRTAVKLALEDEGWVVDEASSGEEALQSFSRHASDVVLIDIMLPGIDGFEVCRSIRRSSDVPIIMVTARADTHDVVAGLEAGADDYLTKPVRLAELLARVRAHLRRVAPATSEAQPMLMVADLLVDTGSRRASVAGTEMPLRAKEFDLLARLAAAPEVAISRETLMAQVWDENWFGPTKTLDVHVAALRRKLAGMAQLGSVPRITTLRGHGYRLEAPKGS